MVNPEIFNVIIYSEKDKEVIDSFLIAKDSLEICNKLIKGLELNRDNPSLGELRTIIRKHLNIDTIIPKIKIYKI